ncbi:hypothetical protein BESB_072610 [Besnoitia besnoiti]|uniref:Uncharacterized protein n=1 Tax=Besnoitia besnoiti TaxID=94643 RepID=A0A2A9M860_BESBE|nr:uncharacterized protein BESB_072610 [Besnoitia besnoiti]PFH34109.1 hypothetical protein BESB_072610 [Besnoitia besnoiti]
MGERERPAVPLFAGAVGSAGLDTGALRASLLPLNNADASRQPAAAPAGLSARSPRPPTTPADAQEHRAPASGASLPLLAEESEVEEVECEGSRQGDGGHHGSSEARHRSRRRSSDDACAARGGDREDGPEGADEEGAGADEHMRVWRRMGLPFIDEEGYVDVTFLLHQALPQHLAPGWEIRGEDFRSEIAMQAVELGEPLMDVGYNLAAFAASERAALDASSSSPPSSSSSPSPSPSSSSPSSSSPSSSSSASSSGSPPASCAAPARSMRARLAFQSRLAAGEVSSVEMSHVMFRLLRLVLPTLTDGKHFAQTILQCVCFHVPLQALIDKRKRLARVPWGREGGEDQTPGHGREEKEDKDFEADMLLLRKLPLLQAFCRCLLHACLTLDEILQGGRLDRLIFDEDHRSFWPDRRLHQLAERRQLDLTLVQCDSAGVDSEASSEKEAEDEARDKDAEDDEDDAKQGAAGCALREREGKESFLFQDSLAETWLVGGVSVDCLADMEGGRPAPALRHLARELSKFLKKPKTPPQTPSQAAEDRKAEESIAFSCRFLLNLLRLLLRLQRTEAGLAWAKAASLGRRRSAPGAALSPADRRGEETLDAQDANRGNGLRGGAEEREGEDASPPDVDSRENQRRRIVAVALNSLRSGQKRIARLLRLLERERLRLELGEEGRSRDAKRGEKQVIPDGVTHLLRAGSERNAEDDDGGISLLWFDSTLLQQAGVLPLQPVEVRKTRSRRWGFEKQRRLCAGECAQKYASLRKSRREDVGWRYRQASRRLEASCRIIGSLLRYASVHLPRQPPSSREFVSVMAAILGRLARMLRTAEDAVSLLLHPDPLALSISSPSRPCRARTAASALSCAPPSSSAFFPSTSPRCACLSPALRGWSAGVFSPFLLQQFDALRPAPPCSSPPKKPSPLDAVAVGRLARGADLLRLSSLVPSFSSARCAAACFCPSSPRASAQLAVSPSAAAASCAAVSAPFPRAALADDVPLLRVAGLRLLQLAVAAAEECDLREDCAGLLHRLLVALRRRGGGARAAAAPQEAEGSCAEVAQGQQGAFEGAAASAVAQEDSRPRFWPREAALFVLAHCAEDDACARREGEDAEAPVEKPLEDAKATAAAQQALDIFVERLAEALESTSKSWFLGLPRHHRDLKRCMRQAGDVLQAALVCDAALASFPPRRRESSASSGACDPNSLSPSPGAAGSPCVASVAALRLLLLQQRQRLLLSFSLELLRPQEKCLVFWFLFVLELTETQLCRLSLSASPETPNACVSLEALLHPQSDAARATSVHRGAERAAARPTEKRQAVQDAASEEAAAEGEDGRRAEGAGVWSEVAPPPSWLSFFCLFVFASVATVKWGQRLASLSHGLLFFLSQAYSARIEPLVARLRDLSVAASASPDLGSSPLSSLPLPSPLSAFARPREAEGAELSTNGDSESKAAARGSPPPLWERFALDVFVRAVEILMQDPRRSVAACVELLSNVAASAREEKGGDNVAEERAEAARERAERRGACSECWGAIKQLADEEAAFTHNIVLATGRAVLRALNGEGEGPESEEERIASALEFLKA